MHRAAPAGGVVHQGTVPHDEAPLPSGGSGTTINGNDNNDGLTNAGSSTYRPDLTPEGIAFYAPSGRFAK